MLRREKLEVLSGVVAIIASAALCGGCGSSSSHAISQAQAQAISHEIVTAAEAGLAGAIPAAAAVEPGAHPNLSKIVGAIRPDILSGCTITASGETCNVPVSYSGPCPGGGTIGISGDLDFTLNSSGDGSDSTTFTVTPTNCSVSDLTINGDPNVTLATQLTITDDMIAFPVTITEGGGISYGPNPSGSCTLNVTYTINSASSCTVSGTLCGQSLSGSC